jgi:F-type H+-transporting ATPase subunit b
MGTFAVLVFFIWRFLWGPLTRLLEERSRRVHDGLVAAERGHHELALMQTKAVETMKKARADAAEVLVQAERQALLLIEEAKRHARAEGDRLIIAAKADIAAELARARAQLGAVITDLSIAGAAKILQREIDPATHAQLVESIVKEL